MTMEKATFAGGCFWCMVGPFETIDGVTDVVSGYMGGREEEANYQQVCSGATGHAEVAQIRFDPVKVSFDHLLDIFWRNIDPTNGFGQFADTGSQYRPAIFYHSDEQKSMAENSKERLRKSGRFLKPIVVEITEAKTFYPAEDYHQDYHKKNPAHYNRYRIGSGRAGLLKKMWGDHDK